MRTRRSVPARLWIAEVAVIEPSVRQRVKQVPLIEDPRSPVREEPASRRLDGEHGPDLWQIHADAAGGRCEARGAQRTRAPDEFISHGDSPCQNSMRHTLFCGSISERPGRSAFG